MSAGFPWWQNVDGGEFTWQVPEEFSISAACLDVHDQGALALIVDDGADGLRYTFGEVLDQTKRLVTVLRGAGVNRGDRVGIMVPQSLETAVAHMACYRMGAIAVPLSVHFGPDAVLHRLGDCAATALIVHEEELTRLSTALGNLPALRTLIVAGAAEPDRGVGFAAAVAGAAPDERAPIADAEAPALLIYTSGTTGSPKGAVHAHRVVPAQMPCIRLTHQDFPLPGDLMWTPADWAWAGGLLDALLPAWLCGVPVVASAARFSPETAYRILTAYGVRNSFLPPTALKQLRRAGDPPPGIVLRSVSSGGEAVGDQIRHWAAEQLGVVVNEMYGQTEINLTIATSRHRFDSPPGSMGRANPGFEVALLDEHDVPGDAGEIAIRLPNPGAFLGYWNQPAKTSEKVRGGYLRTGDHARRDDDGNLFFDGRADDIISSAGYRIGPSEIEDCLVAHPGVTLAAVIGVPDELRGEAIAAYVVLAEGVEADEGFTRELQEHVKNRLAFHQYPRVITYVTELPMTTTGKIRRAELRRLARGDDR